VLTQRQQEFRRNEDLERLLKKINGILGPVEEAIIETFSMPRRPVIFVVGAPRSGTTVLMQWLAQTERFAYPTNLLSRFYGAPAIGAQIQQLLAAPEYSYRDEILDFSSAISFQSELGKTKGALAPNEFWYFWRRFLPNKELRRLDEQELNLVEASRFAAELAAIEAVFDQPLAMKGMILQFNIPFLSGVLDKALFLHIERHPFYNIQSLLESRFKFFGDRNAWYSVKPPEYGWLKDLDPIQQVAGQVYFTVHHIKEGLDQLHASRRLTIGYEEFCAEPMSVFDQIVDKLAQQGFQLRGEYVAVPHFEHTNRIRLPEEECQRILAAYHQFSGEVLSL
jgi:hypothetical protein